MRKRVIVIVLAFLMVVMTACCPAENGTAEVVVNGQVMHTVENVHSWSVEQSGTQFIINMYKRRENSHHKDIVATYHISSKVELIVRKKKKYG
jgi:hypothetical protein